jgi:hypothetical protein
MKSSKDKLSRGQSYPVQSARLAEALAADNLPIAASLHQRNWSGWTHGQVLVAHFLPEGASWSPASSRPFGDPHFDEPGERLVITSRVVPSSQAAAARLYIHDEVVPALRSWIGGILALSPQSPIRREIQRFSRVWPVAD